ncbi:MAG TPA: GDSL-type esterase/lipase family protein, partial [Gammaproteobacteria bacterium]|nr:GDSL-type esterase/lipase family protein [Gammaproteobacteria bacterium]
MIGATGIRLLLSLAALLLHTVSAVAQPRADAQSPAPQWTTEQDHADMLRQLGITRLRPGPGGRPDAANPANYDEARANPYPDWPELLRLDNGDAVASPAAWWQQRRPELVAAFESEIVGRIPASVPDVRWSVSETLSAELAGMPVTGQRLRGRVDNSAYPTIEVDIDLTLVLPEDAAAPVPVMIMFRRSNLRQALGLEPLPGFGSGDGRPGADPPGTQQLIAAGWGFALLDPTSVQADNGAGLTRGIIGLVNRGQARTPHDWGALRAWSWAAARALDYFDSHPGIDSSRIGIEGVSRYGKAALVTMAFEPRFAVALIGSAGEGGVSPYRRNFGETVENLTGRSEYHWMAGNFLKYGAAESAFGSMNANDLPIDAHSLLALAAPRPTFVSYGIPERGDALWLDQQGSYMSSVAAGAVFRLLGAADLGTNENYREAQMPPVNSGLLEGTLAWRQHDGGHTDAPNWRYFIPWAERELGLTALAESGGWPTTVPRRRTDVNSELAHAQLLEKTHDGTIDVYFVGDSITRRWGALDYPELLAHWNAAFGGWNAANFAWGGDRTQNILWRLENGELDGVSPQVFVIQAGTNNLGDFADREARIEAVAAGIRAIVEACRARVPEAAILLT